jgi:hypothetical protein
MKPTYINKDVLAIWAAAYPKEGYVVVPPRKRIGNCDFRKRYRVCRAAINILADLVAVDVLKRRPTSVLVYVGHYNRGGIRITARILGPTRIDGGLMLLTQKAKSGHSRHRIYLLDDLYCKPELNGRRTECTNELWALIIKAVAKRSQILSETTNYFSGATGKVIKIL